MRWYLLIAVLVLTACSVKPQVVTVVDENSNNKGSLSVYFVRFPAGSSDVLDSGEHYGLAVQSNKEKSFSSFGKVASVGVKSSTDNQFFTDATHLCAQATDPIFEAPAFGCRLPLNTTQSSKIRLDLLMSDGSTFTTDEIDTATQYDGDVLQIPSTIAAISESPKAKEFTLRLCPPDADGNQAILPLSKECPAAAKTGVTETTNSAKKDCPPPNYIDNSGKCVSVAESKKELCASGNYILLGGKGCGACDAATQISKMGMCVCKTNYIPDPANPQKCMINLALNDKIPEVSSTSGGGSCSLIR